MGIPPEVMTLPVFSSRETLKRLWWVHDSYWHAALVKELGHERANRFNLEASEKLFRLLTITLLREKVIRKPRNIQDLMNIFQVVWKNAFFDDLYINEPVQYNGNHATWIGTRCHAFDSLRRAGLLSGYACGCQALRTGVMKALRLEPIHEIQESLVGGDKRCVIRVSFVPVNR